MILSAMMILGCWTGSVDLTHKFTGDGVCEEYSLKFEYEESSQKLNVKKLGVRCPDGFDTMWTDLSLRVGEDGSLWLKPARGDEGIVGWFRDGEFHVEDALNAWMYNFWSGKHMVEDASGETPVETLVWEDRLLRKGEDYWALSGALNRASCSDFDQQY